MRVCASERASKQSLKQAHEQLSAVTLQRSPIMDPSGHTEEFLKEFSRHYEQIKKEDGWGDLLARGSLPATSLAGATLSPPSVEGATASAAVFQKGDKVELHDLKAAADLNGELGKVIRFNAETQRYSVRLLHRRGKANKAMSVKVKVDNLWKYNAVQNAWRDGQGEGEDEFDRPSEGDDEVDVGGDEPSSATDTTKEQKPTPGNEEVESVAEAKETETAASPMIVVNKPAKKITIDYSRFDNLEGAETSEDEDDDAPARIFKRNDGHMLPSASNSDAGVGSADVQAAQEALELLGKIKKQAEQKAAERKRWRERWGD